MRVSPLGAACNGLLLLLMMCRQATSVPGDGMQPWWHSIQFPNNSTQRRLQESYSSKFIEMQKQHRLLSPHPAFFAVCAIIKDQHHQDIVEWLVHHIAVGVGHFYIYDHFSDPPLRPVLESFIQSNIVTYMQVTYKNKDQNLQLIAYHHCIEQFGTHHEWMGFIDADEFVYLTNPRYPRLQHLLVAEFSEFGGLGVNWRVYGSSGHLTRPNGTLMHSYSKCMQVKEEPGLTTQIKVFVHVAQGRNGAAFSLGNAHIATSTGPTHRARQNSKLPPVTFGPFVDELKRPVTEPVMKSSSQTLIVLLHYHIKSKEEYDEKQKRGYPDQVSPRGQSYWEYVEGECTVDCTLPEFPDEWEQEQELTATPDATKDVVGNDTAAGDTDAGIDTGKDMVQGTPDTSEVQESAEGENRVDKEVNTTQHHHHQ